MHGEDVSKGLFLVIAAPASAELAFDNSAILLRSKVSLRQIASDIQLKQRQKLSGYD
jgi:hypothetical protein